MAKTTRITPDEAERIRELTTRIGDRRFRTVLTKEGARLMRPDRLANLQAGSGRLSEADREALDKAWSNRVAIQNLGKRGDKLGRKDYRTNRAIRSWLLHGKDTNPRKKRMSDKEREAELQAIKALRYLGIDPDDGLYYLRGVTT